MFELDIVEDASFNNIIESVEGDALSVDKSDDASVVSTTVETARGSAR